MRQLSFFYVKINCSDAQTGCAGGREAMGPNAGAAQGAALSKGGQAAGRDEPDQILGKGGAKALDAWFGENECRAALQASRKLERSIQRPWQRAPSGAGREAGHFNVGNVSRRPSHRASPALTGLSQWLVPSLSAVNHVLLSRGSVTGSLVQNPAGRS